MKKQQKVRIQCIFLMKKSFSNSYLNLEKSHLGFTKNQKNTILF